jgi:hypothetical protein
VLPSSLRQLRRVLGVQRPSEWTYYACRSGKCFLEPLQDDQDPLKLPKCDCAGKHEWFEKVRLPNGRTVNQPTGQVRTSVLCMRHCTCATPAGPNVTMLMRSCVQQALPGRRDAPYSLLCAPAAFVNMSSRAAQYQTVHSCLDNDAPATHRHSICCVQAFYLLDPAGAIRQLFLMPEFAAARTTARTYTTPGTWYASPHYKRLNDATGRLLDLLVNSGWELGADGVNLTLSRKNSTSVFIIRCAYCRSRVSRRVRLSSILPHSCQTLAYTSRATACLPHG